MIERVPDEFATQAMPNNQLAPYLAKRGIEMRALPPCRHCPIPTSRWSIRWSAATRPTRWRCGAPSRWPSTWTARSASCATNQAIPAQSIVGAAGLGLRPRLQDREMSEFSRAKAKALLDLYGYIDRDGDGWRDLPDGDPLVIEYATRPTSSRAPLRAVADQHGRDRHPHGGQLIAVARAPQGLARRQADDVGRGLVAPAPRCRGLPGDGLRPQQGQAPTTRASICQPTTPSTSASACCPTARSGRP